MASELQVVDKPTYKRCAYCGRDDPRIHFVLEEDHVFGIANSTVTVWACPTDHRLKTELQDKFHPLFRRADAKPLARTLYALYSYDATQMLMAQQRMELIEKLAKELSKSGLM